MKFSSIKKLMQKSDNEVINTNGELPCKEKTTVDKCSAESPDMAGP